MALSLKHCLKKESVEMPLKIVADVVSSSSVRTGEYTIGLESRCAEEAVVGGVVLFN
jgi:hypothetical protein